MSFLGLGGGGSAMDGYSGLTPDQTGMLQQQGWYPRPDMVLPTGSTQQQMYPTQGYGNLTPAQAATVNQQGFYTPSNSATDGQDKDSLLQKIMKGLNSPTGESAIKKLQDAMAGPQQAQGQMPAPLPPSLLHPAGGSPFFYPHKVSLNPQQAFKNLMQGY